MAAKKDAPEVVQVERAPEKFEALRWDGSNTNAVLRFLPEASFVQEIRYTDPAQNEVVKPKHIWAAGAGEKAAFVGDWLIKPETSAPFALTDEEYNAMFVEVAK